MVKLLTILVLAGLQIGSLGLYANAHPSPRGCPCHCAPDQASFRVWQQKDGPADRFAADTIGRWLDRIIGNTGALVKTELLILLGRSAKGTWGVETWETDGEGAIYANLVVTTSEGKRQVFPLIRRFGLDSLYFPNLPEGATKQESTRRRLQLLRDLKARIMRRLSRLVKSGQWDAGSLTPVQLPLPSKAPALVFQHTKDYPCSEVNHASNENGYKSMNRPRPNTWSLYVRAKNRRLVRIRRGGTFCEEFNGAKCFGGVTDDANGETWWILVKTSGADSCGGEWHSIRLTNSAPVKQ